jgi:hypothetical protein
LTLNLRYQRDIALQFCPTTLYTMFCCNGIDTLRCPSGAVLDIYVGAYLTDWRCILEKSASGEYIHLHLPKYPFNTTQDLQKRDAQALIPPTHK